MSLSSLSRVAVWPATQTILPPSVITPGEKARLIWNGVFSIYSAQSAGNAGASRKANARRRMGHLLMMMMMMIGNAPTGPASFSLDVRGFDDRPPFLDLGLVECGKRFRRLLLARSDIEPEVREARADRPIAERL